MKIEGRNAVTEAVKAGKTIDRVLVQNGMRDDLSRRLCTFIKQSKVKLQYVDKVIIDKESESGKSQGFIAYVSDYKYCDVADIISAKKGNDHFIVVLDGVEDPHNLGSIIRVCECGGVDGIIIPTRRSAQITDTVMRISEGSLNHVLVARVTNINTTLELLKKNGIWVYGIELNGDNLYKTDLKGDLALVIGGEDSGVNRLTQTKCDKILSIPMLGKINSLNASVATGVAVFEAVRQRTL